MADKVTVQFTAFGHADHKPGDRDDLDPAEAKRLVKAGVAVYATVSDAKAAGGDLESAATKRGSK